MQTFLFCNTLSQFRPSSIFLLSAIYLDLTQGYICKDLIIDYKTKDIIYLTTCLRDKFTALCSDAPQD